MGTGNERNELPEGFERITGNRDWPKWGKSSWEAIFRRNMMSMKVQNPKDIELDIVSDDLN